MRTGVVATDLLEVDVEEDGAAREEVDDVASDGAPVNWRLGAMRLLYLPRMTRSENVSNWNRWGRSYMVLPFTSFETGREL